MQEQIMNKYLKSKQNGRCFAYDIFQYISLNKCYHNLIEFSLKFVLRGPFHNKTPLVQIMVRRQTGD